MSPPNFMDTKIFTSKTESNASNFLEINSVLFMQEHYEITEDPRDIVNTTFCR